MGSNPVLPSLSLQQMWFMSLPLASADQRQTTHVTAHLDPCVMLAVNTAGSAEVPPFSFLSHKEKPQPPLWFVVVVVVVTTMGWFQRGY